MRSALSHTFSASSLSRRGGGGQRSASHSGDVSRTEGMDRHAVALGAFFIYCHWPPASGVSCLTCHHSEVTALTHVQLPLVITPFLQAPPPSREYFFLF